MQECKADKLRRLRYVGGEVALPWRMTVLGKGFLQLITSLARPLGPSNQIGESSTGELTLIDCMVMPYTSVLQQSPHLEATTAFHRADRLGTNNARNRYTS